MSVYKITKKELKELFIEDFEEGDLIRVGDYLISVEYGQYSHPSLKTTVSKDFQELGCTVGVRGGRPYFLDNFISKRKNTCNKKIGVK